ncbi:MAG: hypothetical protein ACC707_10100 [Thiohalomonadales bacterium]
MAGSYEDARINALFNRRTQSIKRHINALLCLIIFLLIIPIVQADNLEIPTDIGAGKHRLIINTPDRGLSMEQVQQQYGEPSEIINAVGDPPITRWIYPKFTVHFESEFVIHAVIKK